MQYWKAARYRASLVQRGEVEVVSIERMGLVAVRAMFAMLVLSVLYSSVVSPIADAWMRVAGALAKPHL